MKNSTIFTIAVGTIAVAAAFGKVIHDGYSHVYREAGAKPLAGETVDAKERPTPPAPTIVSCSENLVDYQTGGKCSQTKLKSFTP